MTMTLDEARSEALRLISKHLPDRDIEFGFSNTRRTLGSALQRRGKPRWGRIELSRHHVRYHSREEVVDTILHEIAHIMAGPDAGHGPKWKAACRRIGARPQRLSSSNKVADGFYRYRIRCRGCGEMLPGGYHRRPRRDLEDYHHVGCGGALMLVEG